MAYELTISAEADRCIEDLLLWYEAEESHGGAEFSGRWLDLLEAAFEELIEHPERHGFAPETGLWMPAISIRQLRFKPWRSPSVWRVLFVIDEMAKRVTAVQIRHEKRPLQDNEKR